MKWAQVCCQFRLTERQLLLVIRLGRRGPEAGRGLAETHSELRGWGPRSSDSEASVLPPRPPWPAESKPRKQVAQAQSPWRESQRGLQGEGTAAVGAVTPGPEGSCGLT